MACSGAARVDAQDAARPAGTRYTGKAFTFNEVAPGVYHAVGTGALSVGCNASIVVIADDVLVVDTHMTPGGAWALREELKALTPPVRYVINTHWHFAHARVERPDDLCDQAISWYVPGGVSGICTRTWRLVRPSRPDHAGGFEHGLRRSIP